MWTTTASTWTAGGGEVTTPPRAPWRRSSAERNGHSNVGSYTECTPTDFVEDADVDLKLINIESGSAT